MAYINALYELMQMDKNVCSLLSDSGTEYDEMMFREFPNQCFNFGIAEENKVAAAGGMAACGKIPFVYTTGAFLAYRSYEFIRDDICFQNRNVKVVGMGSGLAWSTLGPSHHSTEDLAVLRAMPNLTILSPASPLEVKKCVNLAYEIKGPVYIRIGMSREREIYQGEYQFVFGKNIRIKAGGNPVVFSTGSVISEVLDAAEKLKEQNINVTVVNVPFIKPFDEENILKYAEESGVIFSVEEHSIIGGLGGAIAEILSERNVNARLVRIGIQDCFAKGYGTLEDVRKANRLDSASIYDIIMKSI
ncbi:MAG: transketolase family protein [Suilimivivens sp.]